MFLKILQNAQMFPLAQEFLVNFAKFKETFFRKTPTVAAFHICTIRDLNSNTVCNKSEAEA